MALAALVVTAWPAIGATPGTSLAAQQASVWNVPAGDAPPAPSASVIDATSDRARLGVYLEPGCSFTSRATGDCPAPPVVTRVVEGAPADEAGIQPRDTLLTLDGVPLRTERGRRMMATLEDGEPVRLGVGRSTGRRTVRVTPTTRPMEGVFQVSGASWRWTPSSDMKVFRLRDAEGGTAEFHFTVPDTPRGDRDGFVVFRSDGEGSLKVGVANPNVGVVMRDGRLIELAELEDHLRVAEQPGRAGDGDGPSGIAPPVWLFGDAADLVEVSVLESEGTVVAGRPPRSLVLEDAALARRLELVRRETLSTARARIDSVLRVGERGDAVATVRARLAPTPEPGPSPRSVVSPRVRPAEAPQPSGRLAGAEFWALTDGLGDNFAVDRGLLVLRVIPETPAHGLGLRSGDVVVAAEGTEVSDIHVFRTLLEKALARGEGLGVKWNRKGEEMEGLLSP